MGNDNQLYWILGGIALIVGLIWFSQSSGEFVEGNSDTVVNRMIAKCGMQIGGASEEQRLCLINDLKAGDAVDDCLIVGGNLDSLDIQKNQKIINCYLKIDYNDEQVMA